MVCVRACVCVCACVCVGVYATIYDYVAIRQIRIDTHAVTWTGPIRPSCKAL